MLSRVAGALRRFHEAAAIPGRFDAHEVVDDYRGKEVAYGVDIPPEFDDASENAQQVRAAPGGEHEVPCHHSLEKLLDEYIAAAGIAGDPNGPLFRSTGRKTGAVHALWQQDVYRMIQRRAAAAGITTKIGAHTFRVTGITAYLKNKGTLEHAQTIANHASPRTTKLYDRRSDEIALDEVEKIAI